MNDNPFPFAGLSTAEVHRSRSVYGMNEIQGRSPSYFLKKVAAVAVEPMFVILVISTVLYFLLGEIHEAAFMLAAILFVSAISIYQDSRSENALAAMKSLTAPRAKVIRNGNVTEINSVNLVVGDYMVVEEGSLIAADGIILQANDFAVNESILTGESFPVAKEADSGISKGTIAVSGLAVCRITAIGTGTALGKIGKTIESIRVEKTPLQAQIDRFVRQMALAGGLVFLVVWAFNYLLSRQLADSLLKALTLAMSILPEEIPVAFTTFMALGAWRLMQQGIIVKEMRTVEALGSATVICTDKTGTITENRMELAAIYLPGEPQPMYRAADWKTEPAGFGLISASMWASEPVPFDPMEKALHAAYQQLADVDERAGYRMVHEYPLAGKPPMMTHVFSNQSDRRIIAAKGAPETILRLVSLSPDLEAGTRRALEVLLRKGFRVLAVAVSDFRGEDFPADQQQLPFTFLGLVAFYDPPKENIRSAFEQFYTAGIGIKIITGDNALTTLTIARQVGFRGAETTLEGEQLVRMTDQELDKQVGRVQIFTRMFPEAKLRIITALKRQGHIVAMTGDGVNDGPALKAAHIGIAMGKRGSETARESSSLILTDDDLGKMVDAVSMGRKIYSNLKKAVQYIISIHIPIILTVSVPLLLGWVYPHVLTPVHVIFLELIMGPTCSIAYENEPAEPRSMHQPPRPMTRTFLSWGELSISVWQGLMIAAGSLLVYRYGVRLMYDEQLVRTMVFIHLVMANVFLSLVNRSFYVSVIGTFRYHNRLLRGIILLTVFLLFVLITVPGLREFFRFSAVNLHQFLVPLAASFLSVIWFEGYKWTNRRRGAQLPDAVRTSPD